MTGSAKQSIARHIRLPRSYPATGSCECAPDDGETMISSLRMASLAAMKHK